MTTSTLTLANFLLARFAEQRRKAEAAQGRSSYGLADTAFDEAVELAEGEGARRPAIEHILQWNPVHVLADLKSKRRIVEGFNDWHHHQGVLELLAVPYADHPEYREEWRP